MYHVIDFLFIIAVGIIDKLKMRLSVQLVEAWGTAAMFFWPTFLPAKVQHRQSLQIGWCCTIGMENVMSSKGALVRIVRWRSGTRVLSMAGWIRTRWQETASAYTVDRFVCLFIEFITLFFFIFQLCSYSISNLF